MQFFSSEDNMHEMLNFVFWKRKTINLLSSAELTKIVMEIQIFFTVLFQESKTYRTIKVIYECVSKF